MIIIKPINLKQAKIRKTNNAEHLTAVEMGKLWAAYMGNSMAKCVLRYFLQHVEDREIQHILEEALRLAEQFTQVIHDIFTRENHPIPIGFTEEDVNLGAPRLFADELYLHYLKYTGKAGMSLYAIAIPLVVRPDVRDFFTSCLFSTVKLMNDVNELLAAKGFLIKPPYIPVAKNVDFVKKQSYLNGFFGHIRPLQSLEITHLYDNVQNNAISKAVMTGFSQAAKLEQVRSYFVRGNEIASKHLEAFSMLLHKDDLPSLPLLDHLVTNSTFSPFSDKLMVFHKLDMFAMRIRTYANALSFSARHDMSAVFGRYLLEVGNYAEDGANIMIDLGWMEQPPQAVDRDSLAIK
jgi:hypothetical protein